MARVFHFTTKKSLIRGWWEFRDLRSPLVPVKYRMKKGQRFTAKFEDGSTVRFTFIGFAIGCPSPGCFRWVVGTERRGRQPRATGHAHGLAWRAWQGARRSLRPHGQRWRRLDGPALRPV